MPSQFLTQRHGQWRTARPHKLRASVVVWTRRIRKVASLFMVIDP
jgi:hypothetical protein